MWPRNIARIFSCNWKCWSNLRALTTVSLYIYIFFFHGQEFHGILKVILGDSLREKGLRNSGLEMREASTSWTPKGLYRPVMRQFYLFFYTSPFKLTGDTIAIYRNNQTKHTNTSRVQNVTQHVRRKVTVFFCGPTAQSGQGLEVSRPQKITHHSQ